MSGEKYIGLDVHQATISVAVVDSQGKLIMESILETKASTILEFLAGLRGTLSVTFEEVEIFPIALRRKSRVTYLESIGLRSALS